MSAASARSSASRCLGRRRAFGELVVAAPGGGKLAPRGAKLRSAHGLLLADERVEHVELVGRAGQAALLELARHRDQPLARRGKVVAGGAATPGVGAGAPVREDTAREHEAVLVLRPELGQRSHVFVVEEPWRRLKLGLDVGLLAVLADEGVVAPASEEETDRLREDRLARAGLAGDRVQAGRERQLGLADEDEVLDSKAAQHGLDATPRARTGRPAQTAGSRLYVHARAPGWEGVRDGTGSAAGSCADCVPISAAAGARSRYDAKIRR